MHENAAVPISLTQSKSRHLKCEKKSYFRYPKPDSLVLISKVLILVPWSMKKKGTGNNFNIISNLFRYPDSSHFTELKIQDNCYNLQWLAFYLVVRYWTERYCEVGTVYSKLYRKIFQNMINILFHIIILLNYGNFFNSFSLDLSIWDKKCKPWQPFATKLKKRSI